MGPNTDLRVNWGNSLRDRLNIIVAADRILADQAGDDNVQSIAQLSFPSSARRSVSGPIAIRCTRYGSTTGLVGSPP